MMKVSKPSMSYINAVEAMCQGHINVIICPDNHEFKSKNIDDLIGLDIIITCGSDIAYGLYTINYHILVGKEKDKTEYFITNPFCYGGARKDDYSLRKKFGFEEKTFISIKLREWILTFYFHLISGETDRNYIFNGKFIFGNDKNIPDTITKITTRKEE